MKKFALIFLLIFISILNALIASRPAIDDAFIAFRYAWNFVHHKGLVFNEGDKVEGYTSLLWVLINALAIKLSLDPERTSFILNSLFTATTSIALFFFKIPNLSFQDKLFASLLFLLSPYVSISMTSGLETQLFVFLFCFSLLASIGSMPTLATVSLILATLTRPEGFLIALLSFAYMSFKKNKIFKHIASFIAFVLFLSLWRYLYYKDIFPNTFYAKSDPLWFNLKLGLNYVLKLFQNYPLYSLFIVYPLVSATRPELLFVYLVSMVYTFYVILIGGDWLYYFRFMIPVIPLICLLISAIVSNILQKNRLLARLLTIVILSIALAQYAIYFGHPYQRFDYERFAALVVRDLMKPYPKSIATVTIGKIGYYNPDVRIVDMTGLVDRSLARRPSRIEAQMKGHTKFDEDYILALKPEIVLPSRPGILRRNYENPLNIRREELHVAEAKLLSHPEFKKFYKLDFIKIKEDLFFYYFTRIK